MIKFVPIGKVTPPKNWSEIGYKLLSQGQVRCTVMFGGFLCSGQHEEGHHAIWGGDYSKSKKKRKWTDVEVNYQPVCHRCHMEGKADLDENYLWNIERQLEAGYDVLVEWLKLPKKYRMTHDEDRLKIERVIMSVG